jgi:hypothetical protein
MLQGDGGPGKALDQGALHGAQSIGATEITSGSRTRHHAFTHGTSYPSAVRRTSPKYPYSISATRRSNALAALVRPSSSRRVSSCGWVALCERRRAGFAGLSGWQPVGNWVARHRQPRQSRAAASMPARSKATVPALRPWPPLEDNVCGLHEQCPHVFVSALGYLPQDGAVPSRPLLRY